MIKKFRKILAIILFSIFFIMLIFTGINKYFQKEIGTLAKPMGPVILKKELTTKTDDRQMVISKQAVDDLVDKAAKQKYIQDVFDGDQKLPLPKQAMPLQPIDSIAQQRSPEKSNTENMLSQRCYYKGQSYVSGDIVKTDQGWIRCTPTLVFSADKPMVREYGSPAWTVVQ